MSTGVELERALIDDSLPSGDVLYELVNGKLVEKDVSAYAAWITALLSRHLANVGDDNRLGLVTTETVFILDSTRRLRRRPDVAFVSAEKWPPTAPPPPTGEWDLIPDIAIEITSPHDGIAKVMRKVREYFQYGVREVWVVNPEARVVQVSRSVNDLHTYSAGDDVRSDMIPGWSLPVSELLPHEIDVEADENASPAE